METQSETNEDAISTIKDIRQQLETRIESQHKAHMEMLTSIQTIIPNLVSSLDLSLKVVSSFNHRNFTPTPPLPLPHPNLLNPKKPILDLPHRSNPDSTNNNTHADLNSNNSNSNSNNLNSNPVHPLAVVRSMIAACLLSRVPFAPIDSSTVLRKLENDQTVTVAEKAAIQELGGDSGATLAVEIALRSMAEDNGGVELEEFVVSGKARIMVLNIDRTRLLRELPESQQLETNFGDGGMNMNQNLGQQIVTGNGGMNGMMARPVMRPVTDMWMPHRDPHMSMFPGGAPRVMVGMMGAPRGMGIPVMHRLPMGPNVPNVMPQKPRTLEDDMKDLEALLNKKSFRELQKSKTGEELLDLIHRPTAKETAVAAKFKTKGGSQVRQYCDLLTKDDCRRQSGSFIACDKVSY